MKPAQESSFIIREFSQKESQNEMHQEYDGFLQIIASFLAFNFYRLLKFLKACLWTQESFPFPKKGCVFWQWIIFPSAHVQ